MSFPQQVLQFDGNYRNSLKQTYSCHQHNYYSKKNRQRKQLKPAIPSNSPSYAHTSGKTSLSPTVLCLYSWQKCCPLGNRLHASLMTLPFGMRRLVSAGNDSSSLEPVVINDQNTGVYHFQTIILPPSSSLW